MRRWAIGLTTVSLILRLGTLSLEMFWYDEAFTAFVSKLSFLNMLDALRGDVHPPMWYILEWLVAQIAGRSEFVMRMPAAIFGTLAVLELYRLVRLVATEKAARISAALMAIMPAALYYSQEARMYSLLTLLMLMAARAIVQKNWLRWALCVTLLLYTHNLGATYAFVLSIWGILAGGLQQLKPLALVGSGYLAWIPTLIYQAINMHGGFWLAPRDVSGVLYWMSFSTIFVRLPEPFLVHGMALVMAITFLGALAMRRDIKHYLPLFALAFCPSIILEIASLAWRPILLDRALIPSGAALMALWGIGLSRFPRWALKPLAAIGIPMIVMLLVTYYIDPTNTRARTDPTIAIINQNWQDRDALYHMNAHTMVSYDYYLPGKPEFTYPEVGSLAQSLTDETKRAMGMKQLEATPAQLAAAGYQRIWLMLDISVVSSQQEIDAGNAILGSYSVIRRWPIYAEPAGTFTIVLLQL